jgi:hypothetical protein
LDVVAATYTLRKEVLPVRYGTETIVHNRLGPLEKLRDEILQTENTRSDLLKWKLGLVGAIGAAGLGFAGSVGTPTSFSARFRRSRSTSTSSPCT